MHRAEGIKGMDIPVTLGSSTLTVTSVTETTVTLTLVKTDDTPLYAAVYDRMGDALACTDPDYKVDGVTIRAGRIKVYPVGETDGADEPATELPTAPAPTPWWWISPPSATAPIPWRSTWASSPTSVRTALPSRSTSLCTSPRRTPPRGRARSPSTLKSSPDCDSLKNAPA